MQMFTYQTIGLFCWFPSFTGVRYIPSRTLRSLDPFLDVSLQRGPEKMTSEESDGPVNPSVAGDTGRVPPGQDLRPEGIGDIESARRTGGASRNLTLS